MNFTAEEVGYWYMRLNGFLTTPNFIVHPDNPGGRQMTDIDIMGVRFPYRAELLQNPLEDDQVFQADDIRPLIVIGETKSGPCRINRTLQNPENIMRVLLAIGLFPVEHTNDIAVQITQSGSYESDFYRVALCCLGDEEDPDFVERFPGMLQITWQRVLSFIYRRFHQYRNIKAQHDQWDWAGHLLWNTAAQIRDEQDFINIVQRLWIIHPKSRYIS